MQIDFHHTAIYILCRLAGMKSKDAKVVAYASQQVDDATFGHALNFKDGGVFKQTRTGHHGLNRKLVDISDAFEIWIPFHFLPGGEGLTVSEKLICRPEGKAIQILKRDIIEDGAEAYALHRLGIGLHLYADAYSHQDFKGFYNDYNDIKLITSLERKSFLMKILDFLMKKISFLAPVGHGQALKNPDIPYANWSYSREDGILVHVNNLEDRFAPAIDNIFQFLVNYLQENPQYSHSPAIENLEDYKVKMLALLKEEGDPFSRHAKWLSAIHNNFFLMDDFGNGDRSLRYHPRSWFEEAVTYVRAANLLEKMENSYANFYTFQHKDRFSDSDWVMYMRAAAIHKYRVIHKILPECGLALG